MNLKYAPYSWSKISVWKQCPKKFWFKYIIKQPVSMEPQFHFDFGKLVHLIFEHERNIKDIKETRDWSEIIEHKLLDKKDIKAAFAVYDNFINKKSVITTSPRLFAELPLGITENMRFVQYDDPNAILHGYLDDARYIEGKEDVVLISDWKTGKVPEKIKWGQLLYYGIALFDKTPVDTIILNYVYLQAPDGPLIKSKKITRDNLPRYKKALLTNVQMIEDDETFKKEESALCDWCEYQNVCLQV